jgi:hypothetical protein
MSPGEKAWGPRIKLKTKLKANVAADGNSDLLGRFFNIASPFGLDF